MRKILVAGFGNLLRCDDGFGPAVVRVLQQSPHCNGNLKAVDFGIGGLGLVQELMSGYEILIILDAVDRGGAPGSLYTLIPEVPDPAAFTGLAGWMLSAGMHEAVPSVAMIVARAAGVLPPVVRMIGCQPGETELFSTELSPEVRAAVPGAVHAVFELVRSLSPSSADAEA